MDKEISADEVLERIGPFNKYQFILIGMIWIVVLGTSFQPFLLTFTAFNPPWKCVKDSSVCNLTGSFTAGDVMYNYRCDVPRDSWQFDSEYTSIVTKWDLVCDKAPLIGLAISAMSIGSLVGRSLLGYLGDKFGRKIVIFIAIFFYCFANIVSAVTSYFWFYALCRVFVGLWSDSIYGAVSIVGTEYCGAKYRGHGGSLIWISFGIGLIILPFISLAVPDWVVLTLLVSVPGLLSLAIYRVFPESVRWLLVKGREIEARKLFEKIASVNGKEMVTGKLQTPKQGQEKGQLRDLFATRRKSIVILIQWYAWFSCSLAYIGVAFNIDSLGGDIHVSFALQGVSQIIACFLSVWLMNKLGRKKTMITTMLLAACLSILVTAFSHENQTDAFVAGRITLAITSKLLITVAWIVLTVYSTEVNATIIRSITVGTCQSMVPLGYFVASYLFLLQPIHATLPFAVIGVASFLASLMVIVLPETANQPTPEYTTNATEIPDTKTSIEGDVNEAFQEQDP